MTLAVCRWHDCYWHPRCPACKSAREKTLASVQSCTLHASDQLFFIREAIATPPPPGVTGVAV